MSMWAYLLSWLTPTSLFLFINLMIGTIVLTSRFGAHENPQQHQQQEQQEQLCPTNMHQHQLVRTPSLLERVRSINFSYYKFEQPYPEPEALQPTEFEHVAPQHANPDNWTGLSRTPSFLQRLKSMDFSSLLKSENPHADEVEREAHDPSTRHDNLVHRSKSESGGGTPAKKHEKMPTEFEHVALQHANPDNSTGLTRTPSFLQRLKSMDFSSLLKSVNPHADEVEREAHDPSPRHENLVHRSKSESGGGTPEKQHEKMRKSFSQKLAVGEHEDKDAVENRRPATAKVEKTLSFGGDEEVDAKADDFINRFKQQLRLQRLDSLLRYKRNA